MNPRDLPDHVQRELHSVDSIRTGELRIGAILRSGFGLASRNGGDGEPRTRFRRMESSHADASAQANEGSIPSLKASIARSPEHAARARDLVRKRYTRRGYRMVEDSGVPFPTPARSPNFLPIIATTNDRVVGTVTLGSDSPAGLMIDDTHRPIVDRIRGEGGRLCELVRLAVEDDVDSKLVLTTLFEFVHQQSVSLFHLTDMLIEVIPQHANYYCRLFGFNRASSVCLCERVGGVKSILLRLRMADIEARLAHV
jgi:hypothetical protein